MMIWIDVLDASGNKYGEGPITTATGWQHTRRLDAAGAFSFTMPAADPKSALLASKRIVRCWSADENGVVEHGAGIIDMIVVQPVIDGPTMLVVSGDDILRELVNRTVGDLGLFEERVQTASWLAISGSGAHVITLPANIDLDPGDDGPANFFEIGYPETFSAIGFTITSPVNSQSGTITLQYMTTAGGHNWLSVTGIINTTVVSGRPFAQSGTISFTIPSDWRFTDGRYTIRIYCFPENLSAFRITAVTVKTIVPVGDGLQRIMALAPPGWSLDAAGAFATENDVFMQFSGETVLAALVLLANQTGEHFRLSTSGRRVEWLGSTQPSSGLRAIAAAELSPATMLLTSLSWTKDTYALWNRLYVYGGGSGKNRLTLENTTRTAPSGYALSKSETYLEHQAAQDTVGRIDRRESFPDITPVDQSLSAKVVAANALFDRAFELLKRHSQQQNSYALSVIPSTERILPGQTLRVIYHEWVESYHAVDIDADLVVLEAVYQINADGIRTAALMVASVDAWPINDYRAVATALGEIQTDRAVSVPQSGFTSGGRGVPVAIAVENGLVTSLTRETPVGDGIWPRDGQGIDQLTIRSGAIIAINGVSQ